MNGRERIIEARRLVGQALKLVRATSVETREIADAEAALQAAVYAMTKAVASLPAQ